MLQHWTDSKEIRQVILQKWNKGLFLRQAIENSDLFPLRIKLSAPTTAEIGTCFSQMVDWINKLKQHDKAALGYGYLLIEKEMHHRVCGKNSIPTHAEIDSLADAVRLIEKQDELEMFRKNAAALLQEWDCLREWICKHPFQVLGMGQMSQAFLQVLRWFETHPQRNLYLRQLDIEGVDTKFIETNQSVLSQMLDVILPAEQRVAEGTSFEKRYGLKSKPTLLRFRILDVQLAPNGCTDISLPLEQFISLQMPARRIFITENEINFLCFPPVANACVIFGKGYCADLFRKVTWLQEKEVFYWGDIDTHGLNILNMVRGFLPQTKSFLMTQEILLSHRALWSKEEKVFIGAMHSLTSEEFSLVCNLQQNVWGEGVRLEQERIRFSEVEEFVQTLP
ncbi:MAG: DUF2220 family protein [Ruthenibacterium sp.]